MKKFFLILNFSFCIFCHEKGTPFIPPKERPEKYLNHYLSLHKQYTEKVCSEDTEKKFLELFKQNTQKGLYVPILEGKNADINAIKNGIPLLEKKILWIKEIQKWIEEQSWPLNGQNEIQKISKLMEDLLNLKDQYEFSEKKPSDLVYLKKCNEKWNELRTSWENVLNSIPFMKTLEFPVDFLLLRKNYEDSLSSTDTSKEKKSNLIYFTRKILEDGAIDEKLVSDKNLRALLSMLTLRIKNYQGPIDEDIRYDLDYMLDQLAKVLSYDKKKWKDSFQEWANRAEKELVFYKAIVNSEETSVDTFSIHEYLKQKEEAKYLLMSFHQNKMKEAIEFWVQQDPLMQAIFTIDTILMNEVPYKNAAKNDFSEHKDVIQVIINRYYYPEFYELSIDDPLRSILSNETLSKMNETRWPGILFKKGEFSFTYYFISSALRIYCPLNNDLGKRLQFQNAKWAIHFLQHPNNQFDALRYFSRESMFGRIDMGLIWNDYGPISERPGKLVLFNYRLKKLYRDKLYHYLYSFTDTRGKAYHVLKFDLSSTENIYVYSDETGRGERFYYYRNPHHFRYFQKRTPASSIIQ